MNNNKNRLSLAIALGLLGSVASTNSMAAGFQLAEYSATGLGRAYAGEAAIADGADAQWRNVAMLTYLEGTQVSVGGIYVNPNIDVEGNVDGSKSLNPSIGNNHASSEDFADAAFIPNLYVSHRVNQQLAIGFAVGTNYGMETNLGSDFNASHFGNEASVLTKEINVNMAYQINNQFSVGGGIRYVMGEGSFGATMPTNNVLNAPQGTTLKYMEGTDETWGWQVGTAWQLNETNRIGFSYKSEVKLDLTGHAEGMGFGLMAPGMRKSGSMELVMPATAELASYHQLTDKMAVHASFNWTDWSAFEKLEAEFNDGTSSMVKEEHWEDNYRLAVGGTYQLNQKLTLRSGVAYDTSAVSDKNRTITIPETDRLWLSIGAGYDWSKNLSLDAGFTYIIAKDAPITESRGYESDDAAQAVGGEFTGETTGNVWLVGVQANYRF
ncbi:aromatic hydrocarbon degradation protein [Aliivibrio sp. 1S165]|uniref:outer membrane protein transport protein n=1 Tax=unclassified Aliivibrio TaxID=2645654 RepID=UPI00080D96F9|nr:MULTISPECIES: outer membrane protein transport protein [unclassified Aliivibrio]OCH12833.1 aromatic hydrocarbon degradation protein [Aliivibrio sp. 1S165]OCH28479.1 aromatic hydrocarbon degradation protein [Aliivibrio sp. 1S175]